MDYPKSAPGIGLVGGKFIDESVQTGQQGSLIPAAWGNAVTDEILAVIAGAGLTPNESTYDQLLEAIETLIASGAATYEDSAAVLLADGVASAGTRNTAARGDHRHPTDTTLPGSILITAANSPPAGYLRANGAAVSRTAYAKLFAAIGTIYGAGDGSTTFNLPDLRGEFIRGWDDGRGVDAGRTLGSWQGGQNQWHQHPGTTSTSGEHSHAVSIPRKPLNGGSGPYAMVDGSWNITGYQTFDTVASGDHTHTFTTSGEGGDEARPRNVALLMCIKY